MTKTKKAASFEESLKALEVLVTTLDSGDLPLDEALSLFEQGVKLTKECQQQLSEAEQKVAILVGDGDNMQLETFDNPEK